MKHWSLMGKIITNILREVVRKCPVILFRAFSNFHGYIALVFESKFDKNF